MLSSVVFSFLTTSQPSATVVITPPTSSTNKYYLGNRAPLATTPLIKLPVGAITAQGWLGEYLKRQRSGMTGQLPHISAWLKKEGNAWFSKDGSGKGGWEEVPYWLKGYISLAYQLHDKAMIAESQAWIEAAIASQRPDGDFGPNQKFEDGARDFWGNMLMLECLRTAYEATGDHRVIDLMTNYFHYQLTIPDNKFLTGYWQHVRGADNLASIFWLYNITGDPQLIELGEKNHRCTMNWSMHTTLPDWHNVNVAQSFDEPGIYSQESKDPQNLHSAYENFDTMRRLYGQVPGGMFGADENARKGKRDPRQAVETCGMVEQMLSDEELLTISGDTRWADNCEDVAFNTYPAAVTPDFTALRYLTSPNMVTADADNHAPGFQNSGPMSIYNPLAHRCCQHNHSHGWPYFSEHLWMATNDNGLAAPLYSANSVSAKVGNGSVATITEETHYPFEEQVRFHIETKKPNHFPIYLRIPGWAMSASVTVNGQRAKVTAKPNTYVKLDQTWRKGDTIALTLPMKLSTTEWTENKNSLSVNYGPLTFSLKIAESIKKIDPKTSAEGDSLWQPEVDTNKWTAYQYTPKSAWNYALSIDPAHPEKSLSVVKKAWPKSGFPFTLGEVPIEIKAKGSVLPKWQIDRFGLVAPLQQSPTKQEDPIDSITLVPMGAARLRISAFPWTAKNGTPWAATDKPLPYTASASHVFSGDTIDALCDGILPTSSSDEDIPRMTFWDHKGTQEWVQYNFKEAKTVKEVSVYWFDDTGRGECRLPKSAQIIGLVGDQWLPILTKNPLGCERNKMNAVEIGPIKVKGLRLVVQLQPGFSGGILEWQIK